MSNPILLHPVNGGEVEYAYQGRVNGICSNYCRSEPQKWCQKYVVRYCEQEEDCHSRNLKIQSLWWVQQPRVWIAGKSRVIPCPVCIFNPYRPISFCLNFFKKWLFRDLALFYTDPPCHCRVLYSPLKILSPKVLTKSPWDWLSVNVKITRCILQDGNKIIRVDILKNDKQNSLHRL